MESYITHQQFIALLDALGPDAADLTHDLGIMVADRPEQPNGHAVTEGMHDHLPVTITAAAVLDPATGYPWLSVAETQAVVLTLRGRVEETYRYDQIEAALRMLDLPFEPPIGWFQWLDNRGAYIWTQWAKEDQALAFMLGWAVHNYPASPTIEPIGPSESDQAAAEMIAKLHDRAALWREGYRNSVTRVCSCAITLIDDHAARLDTQGDRPTNTPLFDDLRSPFCLRLKSRA